MSIPIHDNHVHLRPDGRGVEAAKEFKAAGGTSMLLVNLPYRGMVPYGIDAFSEDYDITLRMAELARGVGLDVGVALGPYPVLLMTTAERVGMEKAVPVMREAMEMAAEHVRRGDAVAIGEVGRPHFPTSPEVVEASNDLISYAMCLAADVDCPVVLHTETADEGLMEEMGRIADDAGLRRDMVVKHFAPALTGDAAHGIVPSVPASRRVLREAVAGGGDFMMETDYIDDPGRPGAVMSINTVPKRTHAAVASGLMDDRVLHRVHAELPERLFGIHSGIP